MFIFQQTTSKAGAGISDMAFAEMKAATGDKNYRNYGQKKINIVTNFKQITTAKKFKRYIS